AARAVGKPDSRAVTVSYAVPTVGQEIIVPGVPLGTRVGVLIEPDFPSGGVYALGISCLVTGRLVLNQEHVNTLIATPDGVKFFELDIGGGDDLKALDQRGQTAVDEINQRLKSIPFAARAGVRRLGVAFLHRSFAESDSQLHSLVRGG